MVKKCFVLHKEVIDVFPKKCYILTIEKLSFYLDHVSIIGPMERGKAIHNFFKIMNLKNKDKERL